MSPGPFISVIIPSRNRPQLLAEAIYSVLAQDFSDYEIVVVDDGSDPGFGLDQLNIQHTAEQKIRYVSLERHPRGRGPAYARNVGVWASSGTYSAFLDDDDVWTKIDHLASVHRTITANESRVDLYLSNQEAFFPKDGSSKRLWLYPLVETLAREGRPMKDGCYSVSAEDLIGCSGFSHLNTTIIRRELFDAISGIDEYISYEEDLDFFLRSIDKAQHILFSPDIVARHNVPDRAKQDNVSTAQNYFRKMNIRLYLLNKNMMEAAHGTISDYCRQYHMSTLKHMADRYAEQGEYTSAYRYAARALGAGFSLKWLAYCGYLLTRSLLNGDKSNG